MMAQSEAPNEPAVELTEEEEAAIREQLPHRSPVLFEIIRRDGQEEIERPISSLWWSGLVAGLSIGFSLLAPAMLRRYLPDAPWAAIVAPLGYSVGFLLVILSRQQLFTENVITAVVPVMANAHARNLLLMLRLWAIVLVSNVVGATCFALFLRYSGAIEPDLARALHDVAAHVAHDAFGHTMASGMVSGFLIASLVWILAGIEGSKVWIIVIVTYLIALGGFDHIIVGSVDAAYLVFDGTQTVGHALTAFFVPTLCGNMIGGTVIFTVLSYGQIREELKDGKGGGRAQQDQDGPKPDDRPDGKGGARSGRRPSGDGRREPAKTSR